MSNENLAMELARIQTAPQPSGGTGKLYPPRQWAAPRPKLPAFRHRNGQPGLGRVAPSNGEVHILPVPSAPPMPGPGQRGNGHEYGGDFYKGPHDWTWNGARYVPPAMPDFNAIARRVQEYLRSQA